MFTRIVVGTDGSPAASAAVRVAGELALVSGQGPVHVVTGYHPMTETELARLARELPAEFLRGLTSDQSGLAVAAEAETILRQMGVESVTHPIPASGADAVLDVAEEIDADLVVVGSRGLGAGRRLLRGSVSTTIMHHAPCSVLVVHDR